MYTLIAIYYASILGIIGMVMLKRREAVTGHPSLISRLGRGTDHIFQAVFSTTKNIFARLNRRTFIELGHWIAYHVLFVIRKIYVEIKHKTLENPHGRKLIDAVRGRGEISQQGASLYLRRISSEGK